MINESSIRLHTTLKESELVTIENDPAWAEAVKKVNSEYNEAKPEIKKGIEREFKYFKRELNRIGLSNEEIEAMPEVRAYKDAIEDPDDIWCSCGNIESIYKPDGESYLGVDKHGHICNRCKKFQQIG